MIGMIGVRGKNKDKAISYQFIMMLIIWMLLTFLSVIQSNIHPKKTLTQSQFTLPPSLPFLPISTNTKAISKKTCDTTILTLKEGINCFNHQFFTKAKIIFQSVKRQAIKDRSRQQLFSADLYLALIAIEQGEIKIATTIIKHLFFLRTDFSLKQYGSDKKKYLALFKKIKNQGRKRKEIEFDEITRKKFIRVKFCSNSNHCKDGVWLETMAYKAENNFNTDLDCSLRGDCDNIIDDLDLDCSLDGTCQ